MFPHFPPKCGACVKPPSYRGKLIKGFGDGERNLRRKKGKKDDFGEKKLLAVPNLKIKTD